MNQRHTLPSVFLADDDEDDRFLFETAFKEVTDEAQLVMAHNGKELMNILELTVPPPPEVIFLDLNMPLKNGFVCLSEIRKTNKLKDIPVVIFSTTSHQEHINRVFEGGANYYMRKPDSFPKLKNAIERVLSIDWEQEAFQPSRDQFVLDY
jgi:CheY-like chemotaxis protein